MAEMKIIRKRGGASAKIVVRALTANNFKPGLWHSADASNAKAKSGTPKYEVASSRRVREFKPKDKKP